MDTTLWKWWRADPTKLATYVNPTAYEGSQLVPANVAELRNQPVRAARALYERLHQRLIHYDLEPLRAESNNQEVRPPHVVFEDRRGTCLDLALIYAGMCLAARLRPFVAIVKRGDTQPAAYHALVIVGHTLATSSAIEAHRELPAENGVMRPSYPELSKRLGEGAWTAVECTGAAELAGRPTLDGRLDFHTAVEVAHHVLENAVDITLVDIWELQASLGREPKTLRPVGPPQAELSRDVTERYATTIAEAALQAGCPNVRSWIHDELSNLKEALGPAPTKARDTVTALCDAIQAKQVFTSIGGPEIQLERLRYFYHLSVGRWPNGDSSDAMLAEAAAVAIAEWGKPSPPSLTALARFILTVANECGCPPEHPVLSEWLRSTGHQFADARDYTDDECRRPAWLFIKLRGVATQERSAGSADPRGLAVWPTEVSALMLIGDREVTITQSCQATEEGLFEALSGILAQTVATLDPVVDLEMPRNLLHQGIEHWPLIQTNGFSESLSDRYSPRLRWSGRNGAANACWKRRTSMADWAADPVMLASGENADCKSLQRRLRATLQTPYLIGRQAAEAIPDPLLIALREGCGFVLWFPRHAPDDAFIKAIDSARNVEANARRQELPNQFLDMSPVVPAVIWDDPDGRAGYRLPRALAQSP